MTKARLRPMWSAMAIFYFDHRLESRFIRDSDGVDLADDEAARLAAATALGEAVRDATPACRDRSELVIEVRRENDTQPFLRAAAVAEIKRL